MDSIILLILTMGLTAAALVASEIVYLLSGADFEEEEADYGRE